MKDPIQARNFEGDAEARFHGVLHNVSGEMRLTNAGDKCEPGRNLEFVTDEGFLKACGYRSVGGRNIGSTVRKYITEEIMLVLGEAVYSGLNIIPPYRCVERSLQTRVIGGLNGVGDDRDVSQRAYVGRVVIVIEGRNRKQQIWIKCMDPGKGDVIVGFMLAVAKAKAGEGLISR